MGGCFSKDGQKQHMHESGSKMSERTIFEPEDPYVNMPTTLAKPPELVLRLQIQTSEQRTIVRDSNLKAESSQPKKIQQFLKNESEQLIYGQKIRQNKTQRVCRNGNSELQKRRNHVYIDNAEEIPFSGGRSKKIVRYNTADLDEHLQRHIVPSQLTFSVTHIT